MIYKLIKCKIDFVYVYLFILFFPVTQLEIDICYKSMSAGCILALCNVDAIIVKCTFN